jgi:CDP-glycerol glycerophosphotransferase (TagB/SpsB family)
MSLVREAIKYTKHPGWILPRLKDKVLEFFSFFLAKAWVRLRGREALRKGRLLFLYGAFGGRRFDDNSAAFFEYMVANHPEIDSYWVIRKDCYSARPSARPLPDRERVAFKGTFRANVMALTADVYVYSHGRYDITDYSKSDTPRAFCVMLDHGFTALKKTSMVRLPSGKSVAEAALHLDLIASGSASEAKIHETEWGIPAEKIAVTGLARYDRLFSIAQARTELPRNILYMPTWREWNSRKVSLLQTEFFRQARAFLSDPLLSGSLARNGLTLQVYVHMWMREFFENFRKGFSLENIEILDQEIDLQKVIADSALLVTDYSSVCWDFLFLDRPVLFYQFDRDEFLEHTGSYIDLEKDLFGPVAVTAEEASAWVRKSISEGFSALPFRPQMEKMKKFAFAHRDDKNCERLAREILSRRPAKAE